VLAGSARNSRVVGSDGSPVARLPLNTVGEHPGDADGVGDALGDGDADGEGDGVGQPAPGVKFSMVVTKPVPVESYPPIKKTREPSVSVGKLRRAVVNGRPVLHVPATGS
jgi:hypothetical protein